jgi:hypothetical protein
VYKSTHLMLTGFCILTKYYRKNPIKSCVCLNKQKLP